MIKRGIDILFSLLGIAACIPIYAITSLLILIFTPGSVIFSQKRVGKNRKCFTLYKFRTMTEIPATSETQFEMGISKRITRLGRKLRDMKIDELPQLYNVLKGDMSLVGPRPEIEKWTKIYPQKWEKVLSVKPGITDNASIIFRNEEQLLAKAMNPEELYQNHILPQKLDLYIDYVNNNSLKGDFSIMIQTIIAIIRK